MSSKVDMKITEMLAKQLNTSILLPLEIASYVLKQVHLSLYFRVILPQNFINNIEAEQGPALNMGSKRGRLLIRQNRIKKECEGDEVGITIPRVIERQCSEPGPSPTPPQSSPNLLTVPQPGYLVKQHSSPLLLSSTPTTPPSMQVHLVTPEATPSIRVRTDELRRASSTPLSSSSAMPEGSRSCHCPVLRPGPALGCNFCWNTIDAHGRILRRKTKYHCPECQTNLCIVPCFQEYHERHGTGPGLSDSTSAPGTIIPTIMKTSSMG